MDLYGHGVPRYMYEYAKQYRRNLAAQEAQRMEDPRVSNIENNPWKFLRPGGVLDAIKK